MDSQVKSPFTPTVPLPEWEMGVELKYEKLKKNFFPL